MIGMNQIKKKLVNGILIGAGIGLVMVIVVLIITNNIIKGYEKGTNKKFLEEYTIMIPVFVRDVTQGETITPDMIMEARVHKETAPAERATSSSIVGQIAKYNIPRNVALISSMFSDKIVGVDVRVQEINSLVLPSDLAVNEYVDIRIMFPSGIEYIVLPQKQVKSIVDNTIKLDLSEEEILTLNGAIVDSYMTSGTKLYAVKYADPTTQIKVDDKAMATAKTEIQNKIIADLLSNNVISEAPAATTTTEGTTTGNTTETTISTDTTTGTTTGDTTTTTETDTTTTGTEETVAPTTSILKSYNFNTSTVNADLLLKLVTEYAIEYRYYVESYNKVVANYQPNDELIRFMKTNAYVLEVAKAKLSEDARTKIETSVISFKNSTGEESYGKVVSGVTDSVTTQKALRQSVMSGQ